MAETVWADVGERVREARLAVSMTQAHLADEVGLDRTAVLKVERGDRRLTVLEAARIAEVVRVPLSLLVTPRPEQITSQRAPLDDDAPGVERNRARADLLLEAHARDTRWLVDEGFLSWPERMDPLPVTDLASAEAAAEKVRCHLGAGIEPLGDLVDVAEALGLFLLVVDEDVEGASLDEGRWGVAVVGGRAEPGRRRSTAAHELAHHLSGDAYSSDLPVSTPTDDRERLMEAFAAALLLPPAVVRARLGTATEAHQRRRLVEVAAEYRVSWRLAVSAARRVLGAVARTVEVPAPTRGEFVAVLGRGVPEDLHRGQTGSAWARAVLAAYGDGAITPDRAVELLHSTVGVEELPERDLPELW